MAEESIEEKLARLEAENQALKKQVDRKPGGFLTWRDGPGRDDGV